MPNTTYIERSNPQLVLVTDRNYELCVKFASPSRSNQLNDHQPRPNQRH